MSVSFIVNDISLDGVIRRGVDRSPQPLRRLVEPLNIGPPNLSSHREGLVGVAADHEEGVVPNERRRPKERTWSAIVRCKDGQ